ncbi:hypothetical protein P8452_54277 [Trifolium repens]|jgi:hypothetical protein|nr:hypothetical protein P8452_54277 [Trifolium repens]
MDQQIDTSKLATAKARRIRKIILQHKRRFRKQNARTILLTPSAITTTPSTNGTNQYKTPLADITNSASLNPTSTFRRSALDNSNSDRVHKKQPRSKPRPQFHNFQVNLANKFSTATTSSAVPNANLHQSNPTHMDDVNRSPKRKSTSSPTPDVATMDNETSDSSVDDPWDDASDSGTDDDDQTSCVADTNRTSSQG